MSELNGSSLRMARRFGVVKEERLNNHPQGSPKRIDTGGTPRLGRWSEAAMRDGAASSSVGGCECCPWVGRGTRPGTH